MGRFGLVALFVFFPGAAFAQRFEIATFVNRYVPTPNSWASGERDVVDCDGLPEDPRCEGGLPGWSPDQVKRAGGRSFGGRFTLNLSSRFGVDATIQTARHYNQLETHLTEKVTAVFAAVQPHIRFRMDEFIELGVAAGPAIANMAVSVSDTTVRGTHAGAFLGFSLTGTVRAHLTPSVILELQGGNTHLFGSDISGADGTRNHVVYGAGLVYAFNR